MFLERVLWGSTIFVDGKELSVKDAHGLKTMNKSVKWERKFDQIINKAKGTDYKVVCDGIRKDENGTAWQYSFSVF